MPHQQHRAVYKDGSVAIDNWGVSMREIFGAAVQDHDIAKDGRLVQITLKGVKIGQIQLKDIPKENDGVKIIRKDRPRI